MPRSHPTGYLCLLQTAQTKGRAWWATVPAATSTTLSLSRTEPPARPPPIWSARRACSGCCERGSEPCSSSSPAPRRSPDRPSHEPGARAPAVLETSTVILGRVLVALAAIFVPALATLGTA